MKSRSIVTVLSAMLFLTLMSHGSAAPGPLPNPVLYLIGQEFYSTAGKQYIRYKYDVLNKADFPAAMFAAAPALPPCGINTKSSRTWVDFFDQRGKRLYGFCARGKRGSAQLCLYRDDGSSDQHQVQIESGGYGALKK